MNNFTVPYPDYLGKAFAIAGLALVAPACYFFRMYSRVLDYVQMIYVFSLVFAADASLFSNRLSWAFLDFMPSFLKAYCQADDYVCIYGYLLSPAACWLGVTLLMFILLRIASKNKHAFYHFYNFWKGINRWVMPALIYYSTEIIITKVKAQTYDNNFKYAVGVAAFYLSFLFIEVICYKNADLEHDAWKKWVQFWSNLRIVSIMALVVVYRHYGDIVKYFIYGVLAVYDLVYITKYKSTYPKCEILFFTISETILTVLFSFYLFKSPYITDSKVDFLGLALVILLEILLFLPKLCSYCRDKDGYSGNQVHPQMQMSPMAKEKRRGQPFPFQQQLHGNNSLDYMDQGRNDNYGRGRDNYGGGRGGNRDRNVYDDEGYNGNGRGGYRGSRK